MQADALIEQLSKEYLQVKQLDDGCIIALGDLLFTRAIYMDCDRYGYGKRFCFEDKERAVEEFFKLSSGEQEPEGYIARR